jgi:hypothetical protein
MILIKTILWINQHTFTIMTQHEEVLTSMKEVKEEHPYITDYRGTGYCSYASEYLRRNLVNKGISCDILGGSYFNDTDEGKAAHDYAFNLITKIPADDENKHLVNVRNQGLKYGKLNPKSGHVVVLLDSVIYDLTSGQFNFPDIYNVAFFKRVFKKINLCEVGIKDRKNYGVTKSFPFTQKIQTALESW